MNTKIKVTITRGLKSRTYSTVASYTDAIKLLKLFNEELGLESLDTLIELPFHYEVDITFTTDEVTDSR